MDKNELRKADKLKKAIIFDCDNTLWQGVVGEDEIKTDFDIQSDIRFLANHGVIIGLCSKNNEDDINEVLKNQILTDDFISIKRINWNNKVFNLQQIADELNIGLDSIVFVDDSSFEIELIQAKLPEVLAIYPKDLMKTVLKYFDLKGTIEKTKQYKENYQRKKEEEKFTDIEDYLASLDMVLKIRLNDKSNIKRITELTQKTNQFNLTTKRYSEDLISESMQWDKIYSLSVSDRFGDSGLTGICIIKGNTIDTFLLSCRILGHGIEFAFMDWIMKNIRMIGLIAKYIPTSKNKQTEDFYSKLGFECINISEQETTYSILLSNYKTKSAKHFRYE